MKYIALYPNEEQSDDHEVHFVIIHRYAFNTRHNLLLTIGQVMSPKRYTVLLCKFYRPPSDTFCKIVNKEQK